MSRSPSPPLTPPHPPSPPLTPPHPPHRRCSGPCWSPCRVSRSPSPPITPPSPPSPPHRRCSGQCWSPCRVSRSPSPPLTTPHHPSPPLTPLTPSAQVCVGRHVACPAPPHPPHPLTPPHRRCSGLCWSPCRVSRSPSPPLTTPNPPHPSHPPPPSPSLLRSVLVAMSHVPLPLTPPHPPSPPLTPPHRRCSGPCWSPCRVSRSPSPSLTPLTPPHRRCSGPCWSPCRVSRCPRCLSPSSVCVCVRRAPPPPACPLRCSLRLPCPLRRGVLTTRVAAGCGPGTRPPPPPPPPAGAAGAAPAARGAGCRSSCSRAARTCRCPPERGAGGAGRPGAADTPRPGTAPCLQRHR